MYVKIGFVNNRKLEMWANAQRDGRPTEYRWRTLFNAMAALPNIGGALCSTRQSLAYAHN